MVEAYQIARWVGILLAIATIYVIYRFLWRKKGKHHPKNTIKP